MGAIVASDLSALLHKDAEEGHLDGRMIAQFVKAWANADDDERALLIRRKPKRGPRRDRAVTAAITHGMCVHYGHPAHGWGHQIRCPHPPDQ